MEIKAKIIADSIGHHNRRITTFQISLPKVLLAEFNTHRMLSKNFSSTRAIPVTKQTVMDSFIPIRYGKNQAGMEAKHENLSDEDAAKAEKLWIDAIRYCKDVSEQLAALGLHKQWSGRLNDWHVMANGIVTGTEYENFFLLRNHHSAQPEMHELAQQMQNARNESQPEVLKVGQWHLPMITNIEKNDSFFKQQGNEDLLRKISAARCCRVSYNKLDGGVANINDDLSLVEKLIGSNPKHFSPCEHSAMCSEEDQYFFNLRGWRSYRWFEERSSK